MASGWKLKPLHRMLLTSSAFRMASQADSTVAAKDPENDLLGRFDLRRLTAEEIRDSILSVCGNLNLDKTEGPSVFPVIPARCWPVSRSPATAGSPRRRKRRRPAASTSTSSARWPCRC